MYQIDRTYGPSLCILADGVMTDRHRIPSLADAAAVVRRYLATTPQYISRFPTGLSHYVYDVRTMDGLQVVVRMGRPNQWQDIEAAVRWHELLVPRGVPLPALLAHSHPDDGGSFPFMLMERLPGCDLGDEYPALSIRQKQALARRMAEIQHAVAEMPPADGYGFARSYHDPTLHASWSEVVYGDLARSRARIEMAQVVSPTVVDRVEHVLAGYSRYFDSIAPRAFLDDTTTKNVLIHDGHLSGIVDVDWVCFGDPLFTLGLTLMALLELRYDTDYIEYWTDALELDEEQRAIVRLYAAVFCVNFLGEIGQQFNRETPIPADPGAIAHLETTLNDLLKLL